MLALDYKAAFDTISKEYIVWAFKRFNFGENFVQWVEVLMKNTESCINYMGWLSQSIEVSSGLRLIYDLTEPLNELNSREYD